MFRMSSFVVLLDVSFETNKSDAGSRSLSVFLQCEIHPDLFQQDFCALVAFRVSFIHKCFIVLYLDPTTFVEAVISVSMCVRFVLCVFVCRSSTGKLLHQLQEAVQTLKRTVCRAHIKVGVACIISVFFYTDWTNQEPPASVRVIIRADQFEALSRGWRFKSSFQLLVSRKWVYNGSHHCHSGTSTLLWTQASGSAGLEKGHSCEGLRFKFSLSKLPLICGSGFRVSLSHFSVFELKHAAMFHTSESDQLFISARQARSAWAGSAG